MYYKVHFIIKCPYFIQNYQLEDGEMAVRKGLAHVNMGAEFRLPAQNKRPGVVAYACNPNVGEAEKEDSRGSLAGQSSLSSELQAKDRPCLKGDG